MPLFFTLVLLRKSGGVGLLEQGVSDVLSFRRILLMVEVCHVVLPAPVGMPSRWVPLGFDLFSGNQNEQPSLIPLEERLIKDFDLKERNIIVCTDAGLASKANRRFNSLCGRDFITLKPLRRLKSDLKEWALDRGRSLITQPIADDENPEIAQRELRNRNWRESGTDKLWCLDDIDDTNHLNYEKVFCKERLIPSEDGGHDERLIITYSLKYRDFMRDKRESDIRRAERLIRLNDGKKINLGNTDDVRRFIKATAKTAESGKKAEKALMEYELDQEQIEQDRRYDGLYGVITSISKDRMPVSEIARVNRGRWQIEESFRIMKTEFRNRPVFLRNWERIRAHFTTCFMALLVFRLLEFKINEKAGTTIPAGRIIQALRDMNLNKIGNYYTAGFTRTDVTDVVGDVTGMRFDVEVLTPGMLNKYDRLSRKGPEKKIGLPHPKPEPKATAQEEKNEPRS